MQQQTKSPLLEGIPTVPQKFSNDLPDFDLFFLFYIVIFHHRISHAFCLIIIHDRHFAFSTLRLWSA